VEEALALVDERRDALRLLLIESVRQLYELAQVSAGADWADLQGHGDAAPYRSRGGRPLREGAQSRAGRAAQGRARARPAAVLPAARGARRTGRRGGGRGARDARLEQRPRPDVRAPGEGGGAER